MRDPVMDEIFCHRGRVSEIADACGQITPSAVSQWRRVPAHHVLTVERITKIHRSKIRPDIYPPATKGKQNNG